MTKHLLCARLGAQCVLKAHDVIVSLLCGAANPETGTRLLGWRVQSRDLNRQPPPDSRLNHKQKPPGLQAPHKHCYPRKAPTPARDPTWSGGTLVRWQFGALYPKKVLEMDSPLTSGAQPSFRLPEAPATDPFIQHLHVRRAAPPTAAAATFQIARLRGSKEAGFK